MVEDMWEEGREVGKEKRWKKENGKQGREVRRESGVEEKIKL